MFRNRPSCVAPIGLVLIGGFLCLLSPIRAADPAANSGERLALLVGVSEYAGGRFNKLPGTGNDITALGDVLTAKGYHPGNLIIMTNGQVKPDRVPTAANIRRQLDLLLDGREENDLIVVALAGHGIHPRGKGWFFCPADADLNVEATLISLDDLYRSLAQSRARTKVLLVDACRNDPLAAAGRDATPADKLPDSFARPQLPDPPDGIAAFFSCSEGQVARERKDDETYHGVFFKAVIEGLSGQAADKEGVVALPDLEKYVKREVQAYVRNEFSAKQFPEMMNKTVGLVPLVSASDAKTFTNSIGMKFVRIEPGTFMMGSPEDDDMRDAHENQHRVTLTKPYSMAVHHVTRGQFAIFVADTQYKTDAEKQGHAYVDRGEKSEDLKGASWRNPGFEQQDDHPVVEISWNDAVAFCEWLTRKEGRRCRLPTEAEWENACRATTTTPYNTGATMSTDQANYNGNPFVGAWVKGAYRKRTTPVGTFAANRWGLYDMHGNAWQWCSDAFDALYYENGAVTDPAGAEQKPNVSRVQRGGSWHCVRISCRSAFRGANSPDFPTNSYGFRVVLDSP